MKDSNVTFALFGFIVGVFTTTAVLFNMAEEPPQSEPSSADYRLELSEDSCSYVIYVTDEYGFMNVVHPDSLEEFIIKDNL